MNEDSYKKSCADFIKKITNDQIKNIIEKMNQDDLNISKNKNI
jgi:hypothetical protein